MSMHTKGIKGVKNVQPFFSYTPEELKKLNVRHLLSILQKTRHRWKCSCGMDCGDDYIAPDLREDNEQRRLLKARVKEVLAGKPHMEKKTVTRRTERKQMRY